MASKRRLPAGSGLPEQDLPLKLAVGSALAVSGFYVRTNVCVSAASAQGLADVTDVDVLGIRHDLTFNQDTVAVSCKGDAARGLKPAKEIFYLRGVLDYVRARTGVVALDRRAVPPHLRDLGERLNILVLSGEETERWCNSLRSGAPDLDYFERAAYEKYRDVWRKLPSEGITQYLRAAYWFHFDFRNLQNVLAYLSKVSSSLSGAQTWHGVVMMDIAAHVCLTIFDLCRKVLMLGVSCVADTTAAYLFGGATSFKARRELYTKVEKLLASTGVVGAGGPQLPPLDPPYTKALAELVIHFIEKPHAATMVPWIVQDNLWRSLGAKGLAREDRNVLVAEKLAQDLLNFIKEAGGLSWAPKV